MSPQDHFDSAEEWLESAEEIALSEDTPEELTASLFIQIAHVHATLALYLTSN